ncbi:MAG: 30S ribosomal protein S5 [Candidatus Kerfeldbacteria bacterium CG08_land_8_20_14_0_20_43_14]|uniref:Small ribosomal subunit protein uS5 n=1 Tax=Candidatus Kerfeldbacteria bacterium CG08_land_8_20_14_0_20_43_14 TaxID=2014246 RepID=A0A2H0YRU9_9BACT|nr:MAG: 30S ribosomal protein S5 [Candidatus Kerfeldbacteria bacterium CG08_land_8_20_14_0_20_43_14]
MNPQFRSQSGRRHPREREKSEFDQKTIDLARVTRVVAGGKRMRFRACVVIGDRKGRVGMGVAKGTDVQMSVEKASTVAKRHLVKVVLHGNTIPHAINLKFKAARILLKPAPTGSGVIAGGAARAVLDLAGIHDVVSKMLGSKNKINNVQAVILALSKLRPRNVKGKTVTE